MQRSKLDKWKGGRGYHLLCSRRHTTGVPFVVFTDVDNREIKDLEAESSSIKLCWEPPRAMLQLTLLKNRQLQTPLNWKISTEKIKSYACGNAVWKVSKESFCSVVNLAIIYPLFSSFEITLTRSQQKVDFASRHAKTNWGVRSMEANNSGTTSTGNYP